MTLPLSHAHRHTYEAILGHPTPHNLHWRDVRSLLGAIGEVVEEPNGHIKVKRNGQTLVLHATGHKDLSTVDQIKQIRQFLERSGEDGTPVKERGVHLLVVIDHRQARVYRSELRGSVPQKLVPYDPDGSGRHLHYVENDSNGQRRPERRSYYDAIAKSLHGAEGVLVFGGGKGAGSAMDQLIAELKSHHKDIAAKVVGSVVVDEHHSTEDQLLAKAREFYAGAPTGR